MMQSRCSFVVPLCFCFAIILLFYPYLAISSCITSDKNWQSFTNTNFVRGIAIGNFHIFTATTMGINQYHKDTRAWEKTLTTTNGLLDNDVNVVAVDRGAVSFNIGQPQWIGQQQGVAPTDTLWCVTRKGITSYDPKAGIWKNYTRKDGVGEEDIVSIGITDNYILFESDKEICCWYNKSMSSMEVGTLTMPEKVKWFGKKDNTMEILLKTGTITSLYYEPMNGMRYRFSCAAMDNHYLWLGTWGGGIYDYDINTNEWKQQINGLKTKEAALIASDGTSIWIAGQSKSNNLTDSGITCYTPFDNQWNYIYRSEKANATNTIGSNWVTCLLPEDNIIWFGYQGGVSRYDTSSKQWLSFTKKNTLIDGNVKAIVNDKDSVWVITRWGINRFCRLSDRWSPSGGESPSGRGSPSGGGSPSGRKSTSGKWEQYLYPLELSKNGEYLTAAVVYDNALWTAFSWLGVYRFEYQTGKWEQIDLPEGFEKSYIYCFMPDCDGLWFGTDRGVLRLSNQSWESLTEQDGIISNKVFCINKNDEYVFFGTSSGVSSYCKQDGWIRNYTMNDGLIDNDIRSIAISEHCVYFGTPVGMTAFYW
ncbi:MAG: hypothetical protein ABH870_06950 [bacterium]